MAKPRAPASGGAAGRGARKRKARDDFFEDDDDGGDAFHDTSDGEAGRAHESEEEEEEIEETADEKRLRLAKLYLGQVRQLQEADAADDADADGRVAEHLRAEALDGIGHLRRRLAHRVALPEPPLAAEYDARAHGIEGGRLLRGHRLSVTAVALTADDATLFSVSKDGSVLRFDVETGARTRLQSPRASVGGAAAAAAAAAAPAADWVRPAARTAGGGALLAAAVSSDGRHLAVGGGDRAVHVYDARSGALARSLPGHKDAVTGLAFREGTSTLFSASLDRSVKVWSLDDGSYVDTLFGHQAGALAVAAGRAERALTVGADRTARLWKVPEESQLVFRGGCPVLESCALTAGGGEWVTGAADGSVQLWSAAKKKAICTVRDAHRDPGAPPAPGAEPLRGAGGAPGAAAAWVSAVAACRGADLVASGAGDGALRLWAVADGGRAHVLQPVGALPVRGFVNSLALARSGRFVAAGLGQEPRMGRWLRDARARNGVLVAPLPLADE